MKTSNFNFVFLVGKRVKIKARDETKGITGKVKQSFQDFVVLECEESNVMIRQDDIISIEVFNKDKE